jgi:hypothetical protein
MNKLSVRCTSSYIFLSEFYVGDGKPELVHTYDSNPLTRDPERSFRVIHYMR